jgi:hypothetical protein
VRNRAISAPLKLCIEKHNAESIGRTGYLFGESKLASVKGLHQAVVQVAETLGWGTGPDLTTLKRVPPEDRSGERPPVRVMHEKKSIWQR